MEDSVEGGRWPSVTVLREEDARAVGCRAPEHRRVDRTGPRERASPRLPGESCESVALRGETTFYLPKVLRKEELPIEPDTEEAGRLVGSEDVPVERKRLPRGRVRAREVEELAFSRLEHDASRPCPRLDRGPRLPEKVAAEVRRTADGEDDMVYKNSRR